MSRIAELKRHWFVYGIGVEVKKKTYLKDIYELKMIKTSCILDMALKMRACENKDNF